LITWPEDTTMHQQPASAAACLVLAASMLAGAPARAQTGSEAVYAVTYIDMSTDWILQGGGLLKGYRDQSRKEADNLEFTVLQETARPNRFAIFEGWKDQATFDAHAKGANAYQFNFILEAIRNAPPDRYMLKAFATAPARPTAGVLYMLEHIDFMGGDPAIVRAAEPLVRTLAAGSQKEAGVARYDVYQLAAPRLNHFEVVSAWSDAGAYDGHETAATERQFRAATTLPASPPRVNLYDQRLYKVLD
jgi:quinol monooxygenase YgiN